MNETTYSQRSLYDKVGRGKRQHVPHASIILIECHGTISASCRQVMEDLFVARAQRWIEGACEQSAPVVKPRHTSVQSLLEKPMVG